MINFLIYIGSPDPKQITPTKTAKAAQTAAFIVSCICS